MNWESLKRLDEAPETGVVLAYTRTKVFFEKYSSMDYVKKLIDEEELLELHMFDQKKEYRCIRSRSRRFCGDSDTVRSVMVEWVADFPEEKKKSVYAEQVKLDRIPSDTGSNQTGCIKKDSIKILNHIYYDDKSGMASIDDYRLWMEV